MKTCGKCGVELTQDNQYAHRKKKYQHICKKCDSKEVIKSYNKRVYGLSDADIQMLLEKQGNKCAICGTVFDMSRGINTTKHVDHSHDTGKVRGLLCQHCNTGLGKFKDSVELLEAAKQYLTTTNQCS